MCMYICACQFSSPGNNCCLALETFLVTITEGASHCCVIDFIFAIVNFKYLLDLPAPVTPEQLGVRVIEMEQAEQQLIERLQRQPKPMDAPPPEDNEPKEKAKQEIEDEEVSTNSFIGSLSCVEYCVTLLFSISEYTKFELNTQNILCEE